ncbi:MAG: hypothetical protein CMJ81_07955 [Planctomycetaceae bacterium]|nr:hypothetical protein [Planctomycetaceae bacterium]
MSPFKILSPKRSFGLYLTDPDAGPSIGVVGTFKIWRVQVLYYEFACRCLMYCPRGSVSWRNLSAEPGTNMSLIDDSSSCHASVTESDQNSIRLKTVVR